MNVGLSGKAAGDATGGTWIDSLASQFRSPVLQRNLDGGEIVLREEAAWRICDDGSADALIVRWDERFAAAKWSANAGHILAAARDPRKVRHDSNRHQTSIAALRETEQTDPAGIDNGFVFPVLQQEIDQTDDILRS